MRRQWGCRPVDLDWIDWNGIWRFRPGLKIIPVNSALMNPNSPWNDHLFFAGCLAGTPSGRGMAGEITAEFVIRQFESAELRT